MKGDRRASDYLSVERSATPRKGSMDAQGDQRDGLPDAIISLNQL